ncbi:MAG: UDP-N-acetylmuramate--L-alanine ligase [Bacteroidetes bacterium]|nr:UDP-N-acetylmuramate--L-alanine ligase [Bacteroidota bacterium]
MNLKQYKQVYFIGIGGIGMSALARYFIDLGLVVSGYDKTPSDITQSLEKEGIPIHYSDDVDLIPATFLEKQKSRLVVFTPAIPAEHKELNYFKEKGYTVCKRAEILGLISQNKFTIAVAGTHGKTTTAWMIAHLLKSCKIDCYALLGGISSNYHTNYLSAEDPACNLMVVEADEFDRSFLSLKPNIAIITSIDPDHLDIYGNYSELLKGFQEFSNGIKPNGKLIKSDTAIKINPGKLKNINTYGLGGNYDFNGINIRVSEGIYLFDILSRVAFIEDIKLQVAGRHNILNAIAAYAVVNEFIQDNEKIKAAFESFKGVKRRFEFIIKKPDCIFVDDYAHHPGELLFTIQTLQELFPGKPITGVFQPHLYSRTRDLLKDFAKVLSELDHIILLDIYPAREIPIDGINSELLLSIINTDSKCVASKDQLLQLLSEDENEIFVTLGAGDINRLVEPIKQILLKR